MLITLQILLLIILLLLSAFFAGSETGVYRLSRFRLRIDIEQSRPFAGLLSKVIDDSQALIFSLLIGNNLVNYLATCLATIIILDTNFSSNAEFIATLIMTPTLFIFAEVVPKNIYYHHANPLMNRLSPVLWFSHKVFTYTGLVMLLKSFSKLVSAMLPAPSGMSDAISATGTHIARIIHETHEEGILTPTQTEIMNRLIDIPNVTLNSVMTPIHSVKTLNVESDRQVVMKMLRKSPFTRLPVYEKRPDNIVGYINIYRVLESGTNFENLRDFLKPLNSFPPGLKIINAITVMQRKKDKIRLIDIPHIRKSATRHHPVGIVTMKDLVEELTGELSQW